MLSPLGHRLAVRRASGERTLDWGLVIPGGEDMLTAHVGIVTAAGRGHRVRDAWHPLDVHVGDRVIYSSRSDTFTTDAGVIDIVEENSVLGVFDGDC